MSEPARHTPAYDPAPRASGNAAPLRDWLAAMRTAAEARPIDLPRPRIVETTQEKAPLGAADLVQTTTDPIEESRNAWSPRLVNAAKAGEDAADDELAEIMAENMMLKAKLRLESERRDEIQVLLAAELRELRSHVLDEVSKMEDLRAERDLWRARCEALASPLFQIGQR